MRSLWLPRHTVGCEIAVHHIQSKRILFVPHAFGIDNDLSGGDFAGQIPAQTLDVQRRELDRYYQPGAGLERLPREISIAGATIQHNVSRVDKIDRKSTRLNSSHL